METSPPRAKVVTHIHEIHNDTRIDEYFWLRDRENPEVIRYLEAENAYFEQSTADWRSSEDIIYQELISHIKQTDLEVPIPYSPWFYYSRTEEGKQYRIYCRTYGEHGSEEVLLDLNELAKTHDYLKLGAYRISPNHQFLAYALDFDGGERYHVFFKNLKTGELLEDIKDASYSLEWLPDSSGCLYTRHDAAKRPNQVFRHFLDRPASSDELLYEEPDETFVLYLSRTADEEFILLHSQSKITSEVHLVGRSGQLKLFRPRKRGVIYNIEHLPKQGFLVMTNEEAVNFKLLLAPLETLDRPTEQHSWQTIIAHREDASIFWVRAFANHVVVYGRSAGLTQIWVLERKTLRLRQVQFDEPIYTVMPGEQYEFETTKARFEYSSYLTPKTVMELDLETLHCTVLKRQDVPGFQPEHYEQRRIWVTARDGTQIPVSIVSQKQSNRTLQPTLLYGYGSYGISSNPAFALQWLPLLERGVTLAFAHVRGGGEMGRSWYEAGKFSKKINTFTDFIDVAQHLVDIGYTNPGQLAAMGRSAGGLLMGAVTNMRPDLFRAIVAQVPFVDVLTTMLDSSIPLTTLEWDEWGDPRTPQAYAEMKAYSPYDNVENKAYPWMLITTGLNDPRVAFWEPAKWVARLRAKRTNEAPLFLYTNLQAGHIGASGRFEYLREQTRALVFILKAIAPKTL